MLIDRNGQPCPVPTHDEQQSIVDGLIRMALGDTLLTTLVIDQLGSLPPDAGLRVATYMVMLAGSAVEDPAAWAALLTEHLDGARAAARQRATWDAAPHSGERH